MLIWERGKPQLVFILGEQTLSSMVFRLNKHATVVFFCDKIVEAINALIIAIMYIIKASHF